MRTPEYLMIHHSLTKDGATVSTAAIQKYHIETNGWRDIGYHFLVERVTADPGLEDYAYQVILGRPISAVAAACKEAEMNRRAIHVCCIGNYDLAPPPLAMLDVLCSRVLVPWMDEFSIPPEKIVGHRDYASYKSCPGTKFSLDGLRRMVA